MKYFNNVSNAEELKREFRRLAVALHPDKGGNEADFKQMNAEYLYMKDVFEGKTRSKWRNTANAGSSSASSSGETNHETAEERRARREKERQQREQEYKARQAEYEARAQMEWEAKHRCMNEAAKEDPDCKAWAKVLKPIPHVRRGTGKDSIREKAAIRANVQAMARSLFPGVRYQFSNARSYYGNGELKWEDGPSTYEMEQKGASFRLFQGRCYHSADMGEDYGHYEDTEWGEVFRYMYGDTGDAITFKRTISDDFRTRITAIIERDFPQYVGRRDSLEELPFGNEDQNKLEQYFGVNHEKSNEYDSEDWKLQHEIMEFFRWDSTKSMEALIRVYINFWSPRTEEMHQMKIWAAQVKAEQEAKPADPQETETTNNNNSKTINNMETTTFFHNVTTLADLQAQFQTLAVQYITDPDKFAELRNEFMKLQEELKSAAPQTEEAAPQQEAINEAPQQKRTTSQTVGAWCQIIDYSEKSFVVTGFGEPTDNKGAAYNYIKRHYLSKFEGVAPNKCKVNVNLRDGLQGICISKKAMAAVSELVAQLNKKPRPQYEDKKKGAA